LDEEEEAAAAGWALGGAAEAGPTKRSWLACRCVLSIYRCSL
jgi:hypothetical protein